MHSRRHPRNLSERVRAERLPNRDECVSQVIDTCEQQLQVEIEMTVWEESASRPRQSLLTGRPQRRRSPGHPNTGSAPEQS